MIAQTVKTPKIPINFKMQRIMLYHSLMGGYLRILPYLKGRHFFHDIFIWSNGQVFLKFSREGG